MYASQYYLDEEDQSLLEFRNVLHRASFLYHCLCSQHRVFDGLRVVEPKACCSASRSRGAISENRQRMEKSIEDKTRKFFKSSNKFWFLGLREVPGRDCCPVRTHIGFQALDREIVCQRWRNQSQSCLAKRLPCLQSFLPGGQTGEKRTFVTECSAE